MIARSQFYQCLSAPIFAGPFALSHAGPGSSMKKRWLEFHDASVADVLVHAQGFKLVLSSVSIFIEDAPVDGEERFQVWSYTGEIDCTCELPAIAEFAKNDGISDVEGVSNVVELDGDAFAISWLEAHELEFIWFSGESTRVLARRLRFSIGMPIKLLETWRGDLI